MRNKKFSFLNKKALLLFILTGLFLVSLLLIYTKGSIVGDFNFPLQINIVLLPLLISVLAYARHRTSKSNHYLFISGAFLAAAIFDILSLFYATLLNFEISVIGTEYTQEWMWFFSRLSLSIFLFLSWATWFLERRLGKKAKVRSSILLLVVISTSLSAMLLIFSENLPLIYTPGAFVGRPLELLSGIFFLSALIGYISEKGWEESKLETWLLVSLIFSFTGQVLLMPFSNTEYDLMYLLGNLMKALGYILVLIGILLDIFELYTKERQQKNDLLKQARNLRMYQLAVENASDQIIITDTKGIILYANAASENITGYKRREIIGGTPKLWGGQMEDTVYKRMWIQLVHNKKQVTQEFKNRTKDNTEFYASVHMSPILDAEKNVKYIVGISRDITKSKQIDMAKSEFIALASHQLLSPLSVIRWHSEVLKNLELGELNNAQSESINAIEMTNKRMIKLVKELIGTFKVEMGEFDYEPQVIDIKTTINDVLLDLKPQIEKTNITVKNQTKSGIKIFFDPTLLPILITNLISNAIKYSGQKGKEVSIIAKESNKKVRLYVTDNGLGIPIAQQNQIFTKFFRAKNAKEESVQGSGLGLYIAKSIIEKAGGTINFTSEIDKGTTFVITFPNSPVPAPITSATS